MKRFVHEKGESRRDLPICQRTVFFCQWLCGTIAECMIGVLSPQIVDLFLQLPRLPMFSFVSDQTIEQLFFYYYDFLNLFFLPVAPNAINIYNKKKTENLIHKSMKVHVVKKSAFFSLNYLFLAWKKNHQAYRRMVLVETVSTEQKFA